MTNAYMRLSSTVSHHGLNPCAPSECPLICLLSSPAMAAMAPSLFHSQLRKLRTASCRWCTPRRAHKVVLKIDWKKVQIRNVGKTPKAALRQRKRGGSGLHSTNSSFPLRRSLDGSEEGVERQQGQVSHVFILCKVISARKENSSLALLQRGRSFTRARIYLLWGRKGRATMKTSLGARTKGGRRRDSETENRQSRKGGEVCSVPPCL